MPRARGFDFNKGQKAQKSPLAFFAILYYNNFRRAFMSKPCKSMILSHISLDWRFTFGAKP